MTRKKNDWKDREGIVYSTESSYSYSYQADGEKETLPPSQQLLRIALDKSGRAGKQVTLVTGFIGKSEDLEGLTRLLKTKCGTGGSCKDHEIIMQGDVRDKVSQLLLKEGYRIRRVG